MIMFLNCELWHFSADIVYHKQKNMFIFRTYIEVK